jgi:hypothetical protein
VLWEKKITAIEVSMPKRSENLRYLTPQGSVYLFKKGVKRHKKYTATDKLINFSKESQEKEMRARLEGENWAGCE